MLMKRSVVLLMVMFFMVSCAGMQVGTTTPKQQAAIWLGIYNAQYDDTFSIMTSPLSTPAQKEIGLKKKAILTQVWPLLKIYVAVIDGGGTPSNNDTIMITELINQLTALALIK